MASSEEQSAKGALPLAGGELLSAISNRIVAIMRDHYGRGPHRAKTYVIDDMIVCVLRNGFTAIEKTMVEGGQSDEVVVMRHEFQKLMADRYKEMIAELTGREVVAFLSQAHLEPDLTLEVFFVDGPLEGFGSLEVIPAKPV